MGKKHNRISLYEYDGMNILVGAIIQGELSGGGSCRGGGGAIVLGAIVLRG